MKTVYRYRKERHFAKPPEALRAQLQGARVETIEPSLEDVFVTLTYQIMGAAR